MKTRKLLSMVALMASVLLLGVVTQAVAQTRVGFTKEQLTSFEVSNAACEAIKYYGCIKVIDRGPTVRDIIEAFPIATIEVVKEANGWGDEMLNAVIPPGLFFKIRYTPLRISAN